MFYSEYNNQDNFFRDLNASFGSILSVVDKETSSALSKLVSEYKEYETVRTLVQNLRASPEAQYHLRSLVRALTHPAAGGSSIYRNDDDDNDGDDGSVAAIPVSRKPSMSMYRADLVKDVTFEKTDNKIGSNEKHVKVWRLRNSGDEAWPEGCKFVALNGTADSKWISFQLSPVAAKPGQIADAGFQFVSPAEPGMYEFRYALACGDKSGLMTSEPLILRFTVAEKGKKASSDVSENDFGGYSKPSPPPPQQQQQQQHYNSQEQQKAVPPYFEPFSSVPPQAGPWMEIDDDGDADYESKVDGCVGDLAQMGFTGVDRNRIRELMRKHGGDVNAVFNELLSSSH